MWCKRSPCKVTLLSSRSWSLVHWCCPQGHGHWCTGASPPLTNQTAFWPRKSGFSFFRCPYGQGCTTARVQSAVTACGPSSSWIALPVAKTLLSSRRELGPLSSWCVAERTASVQTCDECLQVMSELGLLLCRSIWTSDLVCSRTILGMDDLGLFMHHSLNEYELGLLLYHSWSECNTRRINYVFQVKVTMSAYVPFCLSHPKWGAWGDKH